MARPTKLSRSLTTLLAEVRACRACEGLLPLGPRPVLRADVRARVLVVGQAPGTRVHETGVPWNDPSGDRLRAWMGVDRERFYDEQYFAIIPIGYCYPGRGKAGDMPPRKECSQLWLPRLLDHLPHVELIVLAGQYAHAHYLAERRKKTLTETVRAWQEYAPRYLPLPHPSGRNNIWLKRNPWFDAEVVPELRRRCKELGVV